MKKTKYEKAAEALAHYILLEACCETLHHEKSDYHGNGEICKPYERMKRHVEVILGDDFDKLRDI